MAKEPVINIDESPMARDWLHTKWDLRKIPAYRTDAFFEWLDERDMTLADFKLTGLYKRAREEGLINSDDEWAGKKA